MKSRIRPSFLASIAALVIALLLLSFHRYDGSHGVSWHPHGDYSQVANTGLPIAILVSYFSFVFGVVRSRSLISRYSSWVSRSEGTAKAVVKILPALGVVLLVIAIAGFLVVFTWILTFAWPINRAAY